MTLQPPAWTDASRRPKRVAISDTLAESYPRSASVSQQLLAAIHETANEWEADLGELSDPDD